VSRKIEAAGADGVSVEDESLLTAANGFGIRMAVRKTQSWIGSVVNSTVVGTATTTAT
jgi:hypothetical protein